MNKKFNQLLDDFSVKITRFQNLFTQFQNYSTLLISNVYDEFFSLYVGNIWLPRHMNERSRYEHIRQGRDHAELYKGAWTSRCSMDGIQYEANRLQIEDERIENRINQILPLMDSFPSQFQRIIQTMTTKLRQLSVKDSLKMSFEHQIEKLEFRIETNHPTTTVLNYQIQRKKILNTIELPHLTGYFNYYQNKINPPVITKKRVIEDDDDGDGKGEGTGNRHGNIELNLEKPEKLILDLAVNCSKHIKVESLKTAMKSSSSSTISATAITTEPHDISLDAIKRQYGVDPKLMRAHQNALENETKFSNPTNAYLNISESSRVIPTSSNQAIPSQKIPISTENKPIQQPSKESRYIESIPPPVNIVSPQTWKEKNEILYKKWKEKSQIERERVVTSTAGQVGILPKQAALNISVSYRQFEDERSIITRPYQTFISWHSKFSENFPIPSGQISKNSAYLISITALFESIYHQFWLDNIPILPNLLKITDVTNQTELKYSLSSSLQPSPISSSQSQSQSQSASVTSTSQDCCRIDQLLNVHNLIRIQCHEDLMIQSFLNDLHTHIQQTNLTPPPFCFVADIVNYLIHERDCVSSVDRMTLSLCSSLKYSATIITKWLPVVIPIISRYLPARISLRLSLSYVTISNTTFRLLLYTCEYLQLISCSSDQHQHQQQSPVFSHLFNDDFNSLSKSPLQELQIIYSSQFSIFHSNFPIFLSTLLSQFPSLTRLDFTQSLPKLIHEEILQEVFQQLASVASTVSASSSSASSSSQCKRIILKGVSPSESSEIREVHHTTLPTEGSTLEIEFLDFGRILY